METYKIRIGGLDLNKKILVLLGVFVLLAGTFTSFASSNEVPMAYLKKLNDLVDHYGYGYTYEGGYMEEHVDPIDSIYELNYLASVGFIDLDEDGQVEMLTIYGGYEGGRAIDIYSLQGESVEKVLSLELAETGLREAMIYGFVDLDSRYFYKYDYSYGLAGFDGTEKIELYKLDQGKMGLEKEYEHKSEENSESLVTLSQAGNKKDIKLEEFAEIRNKITDNLNGQILEVGTVGAGSIGFYHDLFNNPRVVLDKLPFTSVIEPSKLERLTESFKGEKLERLQGFINKTYGIINYDENYDDYDSFLVLSKFHETDFENDLDEYDKIDVNLANERIFDIFGKKVNLKSPIKDKKYDFEKVECDESSFININVRIPKEIYKLNEDMYYITIHDFLYSDYGLQEETYKIYNEYTNNREFLDQFYDINVESFPQVEVLTRYPTYLIVKENEKSSLGYSLVKSGNIYDFLTDEELDSYREVEEEEKPLEEEEELEADPVKQSSPKKSPNKLVLGGFGLTTVVVALVYFMKKNK